MLNTSSGYSSSDSSIRESDSTRKKLKKLVNDKTTNETVKNVCKAALKELKDAEKKIERLEDKVTDLQADKKELREEVKAEIQKTQKEKDEKNRWKSKFHALKNPEVVRTEIEKYDDYLPSDFQYNETLISQKIGVHAKNEEGRRQKFDSMLKCSSHDFLQSLRESIFVYWVEKPELIKLGVSKEAKEQGRRFRTILNEYDESGNPNCVESKIVFIYKHANVVHTGFEEVIINGPKNGTKFEWLANVFEKYAIRIADLHRTISHKIHQAQFDSDDEIPIVFNVLKDMKYESCIQVLMNDVTFLKVVDCEENV